MFIKPFFHISAGVCPLVLEWLFIERLVISAVLGGLIGVEREMHSKPAGLRTHILICMGAAMFTMISLSVAENLGSSADVSRIAAGVVTGIGFLAAGSIFREERIHGLTTAADIWVIAAVGMAVGFGWYIQSILASILMFAIFSIKSDKNKWY